MTTGQRIKAARKAAGMTQKELGYKLDLSFQSIAQWENDLRNPKYETLERLADALDIPVEVLLGIGDSISISETVGTEGHVQSLQDAQYDGSIRVSMSPEQREYGELMEKCADGTITDAELRRLGELQAKRPPLEESLKKLTSTLARMRQCLLPLNETGRQKVIEHAEIYAQDLAEIPRYRATPTPEPPPAPQEAQQDPLVSSEGTDTPMGPGAPETPPEGK